MPRRPRKIFDEYEFFHVTARGAGGSLIFVDEFDRANFADCFWAAVVGFDLKCLIACQVGTHYHAVFKAEREPLSNAMHKLNGAYARRFNERHRRRGHLFGDRFSSWVFESENHFAATIPYVLWNPVRAGLCACPEQWRWSWLSRDLDSTVEPEFAAATGRDSPMGQSLKRVRDSHAGTRLKGAGGTRPERASAGEGGGIASRTSFR
jgi:REP-associated tyrosine transposase